MVGLIAADDWKPVSCGCCAGIAWGGDYPQECSRCKGSGGLWLSPSGTRLALYPGGPFAGIADDADRRAATGGKQA